MISGSILITDWLTFRNFGQSENDCKKEKSSIPAGHRDPHAPPPPTSLRIKLPPTFHFGVTSRRVERLRRAKETRALPGTESVFFRRNRRGFRTLFVHEWNVVGRDDSRDVAHHDACNAFNRLLSLVVYPCHDRNARLR